MAHEQRTAIVTGASKGIGAAIALRLAQDGHAVIANYASDEAGANEIADAIKKAGGQAIAVQGDISDPSCMPRLFDAAEQEFGSVDVLVNNAGIMRLGAVASTSDADFEAHCAVNIGGAFRGMREAANRLNAGGAIVSLSSSVVGLYQPTYGVYAATKAAVEAMSHVLAKELGPRGITVNAVAPGPVGTDLFLAGKPDTVIENIKKMNPFGRLGTPEDIAAAVSLLAGPDGHWISGQTLRANGGVI
ncbi:3-oxoacyl-[acyl-carrier-protein] reductase FabG [Roseovarius albus]|uniref:3-oxoacyl-[acyl-carrier-protein] reductase FabG n=1 Tax=Roseovarius albus TaxID=1247867 RepID=A0A1X6Z2K3_9RHOB|nr:SDR family oxidoreductase [Roseovarius albus]SLN38988.1 3-oxoacyl-[acyl-carrier-protein] reductase FabG [Roseovarius albus]